MNENFLFTKNSVYSLRSRIQLEKPSINTVQFGKNFESKIKKWVPEIYQCRLCKTYGNQVGFAN